MIRRLTLVTILLAAAVLAAAVPATAQDDVDLSLTVCSDCHEETEAFAAGTHGRAMARRDPAILERSCAGCHNPSPEHLEDPMPENVQRNPGPEACASCHPDSAGRLHLATAAHPRHGVACLDCHVSGHEPTEPEWLLQAEPYELCGGCHSAQAAAAFQPFSHREGGEPFACVSCHSLHSGTRVGRLALAGKGGPCLDCHTEKAGPFIYPHPPGEIDGCIACHQPHGSTNPRMLTRRTQVSLCLECHAAVPAFHNLNQARFRSCLSCHAAVHGSNRGPGLFDE